MTFNDQIDELVEYGRSETLDRAQFFKRAAALGLAASTSATLLAACGSGDTSSGGTTTAAAGVTGDRSAVPGPPWQGGKRGGAGKIAWQADAANFDPALTVDEPGTYGAPQFFRGLSFFNEKAEQQLDLAESLDVSDDATSFRFKIKEGVTFHHGREVTAEDFKWTIERVLSPNTPSWAAPMLSSVTGLKPYTSGKASGIRGVKTPSRYVLEIHLDEPNVTIPSVMGTQPFYVVPKEEVKRLGKDWATHPVGTGPFVFESFDQGGRKITGTRFDDYVYAKEELPYVDSLEIAWGVSPQLQYLRTQRGDLAHTTNSLSAALAAQLSASKDAQFERWQSLGAFWIGFDISQKPFDDVRVRKAFNHAFNRDRVRDLLFEPTGHFFPPNLTGYDKSLAVYEYDPEKARALLKQAGYDGDLTLDFPLFRQNEDEGPAQLLQQDLKEIGVTLNLKREQATIWDVGKKLPTKYRLWRMGYGVSLPDPSELTGAILTTGAPFNFNAYSNADVDRISKEALGETDPAKRADMYTELEKTLIDDAPFLFESVQIYATYRNSHLQNFIWEPTARLHWDRYWFDNA